MTGLTETEHVVAALEAGGVDYVTKPISPQEVLARMGVHMQSARPGARQARNALDAFGHATHRGAPPATARWCGRRRWRATLLHALLRHQRAARRPRRCSTGCGAQPALDAERNIEPPRLTAELGARQLTFRAATGRPATTTG